MSCLLRGVFLAPHVVSSEMSHAIPRHVRQTLKSHRGIATFSGAAESSGTRIACEFWLTRRPRRTPVFGRRPMTLSTIPGTLRTPPPHPTMRRATKPPTHREGGLRDVTSACRSRVSYYEALFCRVSRSPTTRKWKAHFSPCPSVQDSCCGARGQESAPRIGACLSWTGW